MIFTKFNSPIIPLLCCNLFFSHFQKEEWPYSQINNGYIQKTNDTVKFEEGFFTFSFHQSHNN
jgi:hypothetical protein